jgi:hypothetical protein
MNNVHIVVKCHECGEVRVGTSEVTLRRCQDDESWSYRFTCPKCRRLGVEPTYESTGIDAVAAGCGFEEWRLPTGLENRPTGAPFTEDDVLALRSRFLDPNWLDALVQRGTDHR